MRRTHHHHPSQAPTRADGVAWPESRPSLPAARETAAERVACWTLGAIARARAELGLAPMERGAREVVACAPASFAAILRGEAGPWGAEHVARSIRRAVRRHQAIAVAELAGATTADARAHTATRRAATADGRAYLPHAVGAWRARPDLVGTPMAPAVVVAPAPAAVPVPPTCASPRTVDLAAERAAAQAEHARRQARRTSERVQWAVMVADALTSAVTAPRRVVTVPPSVRLAAIAAHARSLVESSPGACARRGNDVLAVAFARI